MKNIVQIIIIIFISAISYTAHAKDHTDSVHSSNLNDLIKIINKYGSDTDNLDLQTKLKVCALKGNYWCASYLGEIYYSNNNYKDAYPFLIQASNEFDGAHDLYLGNMYSGGNGVLLDLDKAIYYYKKIATDGNSHAAYNLSFVYQQKTEGYSGYTKNDLSKRKYYTIRSHAWLRVAAALGKENVILVSGDKKPIENEIRTERRILSQLGWLAEANMVSDEICSSVQGCNK